MDMVATEGIGSRVEDLGESVGLLGRPRGDPQRVVGIEVGEVLGDPVRGGIQRVGPNPREDELMDAVGRRNIADVLALHELSRGIAIVTS